MIHFASGKSLGMRSEQQDSVVSLMRPDGFQLHLLADGMGGEKGGRLASQTVLRVFSAFFENAALIENPRKMLLKALERANGAIHTLLGEQPHLMGMGTTFIGLLLHGLTGNFHFISVGDSPLYRFRSGILERINANHSYLEELKRMANDGRIHWGEVRDHPDRHQITSAVTGGDIDDIDLQSGSLAPGECLLLATDGVQTLSDRRKGEISVLLQEFLDQEPEKTVKALLDAVAAKNLPDQDNTALILLQHHAP